MESAIVYPLLNGRVVAICIRDFLANPFAAFFACLQIAGIRDDEHFTSGALADFRHFRLNVHLSQIFFRRQKVKIVFVLRIQR